VPNHLPAKFNLPLPSSQMIERSRHLRARSTKAEQVLWEHLRARRLNGVKFRRQHPIGTFVADFFCGEHRLVIELDGAIHQEATQAERDARRDEIMREHNLKVLRFSNGDVLNNLPCVLTTILREANNC
jgi:very-short-patch-repair endonuclease